MAKRLSRQDPYSIFKTFKHFRNDLNEDNTKSLIQIVAGQEMLSTIPITHPLPSDFSNLISSLNNSYAVLKSKQTANTLPWEIMNFEYLKIQDVPLTISKINHHFTPETSQNERVADIFKEIMDFEDEESEIMSSDSEAEEAFEMFEIDFCLV